MLGFNTQKTLGFKDGLLMLIGIPIVSMMMFLLLFGDLLVHGRGNYILISMAISTMYTTFFWLIFRQLYLIITKYYSGYENIRQRYLIGIPGYIAVFILLKILMNATVDKYMLATYHDMGPDPIIETLGSFIFLTLILAIYEGIHLFVELKESQVEKAQLVRENVSSQLEGLKNQVNPHFLFNSLNTLASIITEDQDRSVRFVTKLSKVYRYILDMHDKKLVSVKEELKFLQSYTFLLEERFGNNIKIDIDVPDQYLQKFIVPLSLQITFENAIKHNVISHKDPLHITVSMRVDKYLMISNNLKKKKSLAVSPGMGLLNIKNRYKFYTNREVHVEEDKEFFTVVLPLLDSDELK